MHIRLGDLPSGRWRELTDAEVRPLRESRSARAKPRK
jgi:16S rRNA U516 pseudouridylate synthase RsuA-like enzyme